MDMDYSMYVSIFIFIFMLTFMFMLIQAEKMEEKISVLQLNRLFKTESQELMS